LFGHPRFCLFGLEHFSLEASFAEGGRGTASASASASQHPASFAPFFPAHCISNILFVAKARVVKA
jgi:hypothetical protein